MGNVPWTSCPDPDLPVGGCGRWDGRRARCGSGRPDPGPERGRGPAERSSSARALRHRALSHGDLVLKKPDLIHYICGVSTAADATGRRVLDSEQQSRRLDSVSTRTFCARVHRGVGRPHGQRGCSGYGGHSEAGNGRATARVHVSPSDGVPTCPTAWGSRSPWTPPHTHPDGWGMRSCLAALGVKERIRIETETPDVTPSSRTFRFTCRAYKLP